MLVQSSPVVLNSLRNPSSTRFGLLRAKLTAHSVRS
jgi:hypothetical protein